MVVRGAILGRLKQDLGLGSGSRSQENDIIRRVAGVNTTTGCATAGVTRRLREAIIDICKRLIGSILIYSKVNGFTCGRKFM
jgi:hypothetical protein